MKDYDLLVDLFECWMFFILFCVIFNGLWQIPFCRRLFIRLYKSTIVTKCLRAFIRVILHFIQKKYHPADIIQKIEKIASSRFVMWFLKYKQWIYWYHFLMMMMYFTVRILMGA